MARRIPSMASSVYAKQKLAQLQFDALNNQPKQFRSTIDVVEDTNHEHFYDAIRYWATGIKVDHAVFDENLNKGYANLIQSTNSGD